MCACVCVYPEIQSCAGSGRLCLFPAPHPALCAGRCGPDDRHIDAGRREHCGRREGARRTPPWALRHTMQTDSRGEGENEGRKEESAREGEKVRGELRRTAG